MNQKKLVSVISVLLVIFILAACTATPAETESSAPPAESIAASSTSSAPAASAAPSPTAENAADALTLEPNIPMSDDPGNPPVNDSVQTVSFKCNMPLDPATIAGAVTLYQMDSNGNPTEQKCFAKINPDSPNYLDVNNEAVDKFAEGQEYKIVINNTLKSTSGLALQQEYTGYFATNYTLDLAGNAALNNARSQIVVISDIHLGVDDAYAETEKNRDALVDFLTQIKNSPNVAELVIAGDLLDGWFLPMDYVYPDSQDTFFEMVAANNQTLMDAFNAIITDGKIKVTYTPGNHDLLLTEEALQKILPGINQVRGDVQGLGEYTTGANAEIDIEHGHKYNYFCAPDQISNRDITKNDSTILPPGYFFTRIATSSVVEGHPASGNTFPEFTAPDKNDASQFGLYLYGLTWNGLMSNLPVNESLTDKVIKTNIDGFTEDYALNDLIPQQDPATGLIDVNLYKGEQDTWDERQTQNGVKAKIPLDEAILKASTYGYTDVQAKLQYFDTDASKRIVVFGHTHGACIIPGTNLDDQKTIYANSGTWIDNAQGYPTMTFVVITPQQADSAVEIVNLYKYSLDNTFTQWTEGQAITK